jgi:TonB-dependent receptor
LSGPTAIFGQSGKISGKVISTRSGQPLDGTTIFLVENSKTAVADLNGNFSFGKLNAGTYSITCSYVGYDPKTISDIVVTENENTIINVSLDEKQLGGVVVTGTRIKASQESVASLLVAQKNSASVSDFISAESIRKTPDKSTSDVIKRVSGASIQDDRFAVIRGLNDRYNAAFINGAPLPSTESDRKAFAFDIFPSSILDNLVIYKTATPDKSGEFAGGIIDITTKSILPKSFTSISFGGSYNSLLTGNDRYYSENKGKKDWIGMDDGTRGLPDGLPSAKEIKASTFAQRATLAKSFDKYRWGISQGTTSPNFNFQLTKGFNIARKEKEFLGALFSVNYNKNFTFTEGERASYDNDLTAPIDAQLNQKAKYHDSLYNNETVLALLGNISVKLNNRNNLSWRNNFSINTDDKLIKRIGAPDYTADSTSFVKELVRWYTSNQIYSSQITGEHQVSVYKTKINWLAGYSKVVREIPNLSRTSYVGFYPDTFNIFSNFSSGPPLQTVGTGTMFSSSSLEDIKNIKADITQPFKFFKSTQNFVKIGVGYQIRKRNFTSRVLGFAPYTNGAQPFDYSLFQLPENQIFLPENLGVMANGKAGFLVNDGTGANSDYDASSSLTHAYAMADQRFFEKFRLIYGLRVEKFNQKLNAIKDLRDTVNINSVVTDYLPSLNFVYALTTKMNIRLSYSHTLNRPEFRELAPFVFYDYSNNVVIQGQDNVKRAKITNYDFRFEFFPGRAQLFSASAFYKDFSDPIEIIWIPKTSGQLIYANSTSAKAYGVEAEVRTLISSLVGVRSENSLLSKFTIAANAAYIKSSVKTDSLFSFGPDDLITDRALQGQSPFIFNGSLAFNHEKLGFSSTLSVNRVGDRIYIAGSKRDANIYEKARTIIDFQIAKFLVKGQLELKFTVKDILAQKVNFYYDFDQSKTFTSKDRSFASGIAPRIFSFTASYKFNY